MTIEAAKLANHEVVTIAVFLLRGDVQAVDTEDAAVKAAEIAPGRFSWRKYPEQINFESVRRRLTTAADDYGYVVGSQRDGWRLTDKGRRFAQQKACELDVLSQRRPLSLREKQWRSRERERMLASAAYAKYAAGEGADFATSDADRFFRIDEHVGPEQRRTRIERALVFFGEDEELGHLVQAMAQLALGGEAG